MKKLITLILYIFSCSVYATDDIDDIAGYIYTAFQKESIAQLDNRYILENSITIEIEHTIAPSENDDVKR